MVVPLYWSQNAMSLKPSVNLERSDTENRQVFQKYYDQLNTQYGSVISVNLIDQVGREAAIGHIFGTYMTEITALAPKNKYIAFDFHHECRGLAFKNTSKLIDALQHSLENEIRFTWVSGTGAPLLRQRGIVRTNCIDCVDRTNVVQSAVARRMVQIQCEMVGDKEVLAVLQDRSFQNAFNQQWTSNGDNISLAYTGTSALKRDFVLTGKRRFAGVLSDAYSSVTRMYKNAYRDYFRTLIIEYFVGQLELSALTTRERQEDMRRKQVQMLDHSLDTSDMVKRLRLEAIRQTKKLVMSPVEEEDYIAGCIAFLPYVSAQLKRAYVERIIHVTPAALYICQYRYDGGEVLSLQRIGISDMQKVVVGSIAGDTADTLSYGLVLYFGQADRLKDSLSDEPSVSAEPSSPDEKATFEKVSASAAAPNTTRMTLKILEQLTPPTDATISAYVSSRHSSSTAAAAVTTTIDGGSALTKTSKFRRPRWSKGICRCSPAQASPDDIVTPVQNEPAVAEPEDAVQQTTAISEQEELLSAQDVAMMLVEAIKMANPLVKVKEKPIDIREDTLSIGAELLHSGLNKVKTGLRGLFAHRA